MPCSSSGMSTCRNEGEPTQRPRTSSTLPLGCHRSALAEAIHARTNAIERLERSLTGLRANVAPSDGYAEARARFIQRTPRALKAQPSIATGRAETLRDVERNATQSAPNLRRQLTVAPSHPLDERPRPRDDLKYVFQKPLADWAVHALHPRSFRDTGSRKCAVYRRRWRGRCAPPHAQPNQPTAETLAVSAADLASASASASAAKLTPWQAPKPKPKPKQVAEAAAEAEAETGSRKPKAESRNSGPSGSRSRTTRSPLRPTYCK